MIKTTTKQKLYEAMTPIAIGGGVSGIFAAAADLNIPAAGVAIGATIIGIGSIVTDLASDLGKLKKRYHLAAIFASGALTVAAWNMSLNSDETPAPNINNIENVAPAPDNK